MDGRGLDRLGVAAGMLAWLAVGVPVAIQQISGESIVDWPVLWWCAYLAYGAVFGWSDADLFSPSPRLPLFLLGLQFVTGLVTFGLAPEWGFTSVLLVITAASAAFVLRMRGAVLLVAAQTAATVAVTWSRGDAALVITSALVYAGFQMFAVLMVETSLRATEARVELARVNAELQAAQSLLAESSRSAERLRIARDLHDMVGHQLTALALELEVASHHAVGRAREHVDHARLTAKTLLADVRSVVSQLREPPPDLAGELRALSTSVEAPRVHLTLAADLAVTDAEQSRAVARCVQEIITNAVRHASADNLWIEVCADAAAIEVRASDDGRGASAVRQGNGLAGMRERFELLGGRVSFSTARGQGFTVQAVLPQ